MDDEDLSLTIILLTRRRPVLLRRALASLAAQQPSVTDILVLIDDCRATELDLSVGRAVTPQMQVIFRAREPGEHSGPARVGRLRNFALGHIGTRWCAFLDDDNTVEPDHYASLLRCAQASDSALAHSWRRLRRPDGHPYALSGEHPWCRDRAASRSIFDRYAAAGIYRSNCAVVRDQVVPGRRDLSMVDTSEWLFQTSFIRTLGFETTYSAADWMTARCEDSKLLDHIVELGCAVPSTRRPSLNYFLGGYSNNAASDGAQLSEWPT